MAGSMHGGGGGVRGMRSMSGRYASYCNTFLFVYLFTVKEIYGCKEVDPCTGSAVGVAPEVNLRNPLHIDNESQSKADITRSPK